MKLYKNVDICDLESILNKGILSLDESGNDNWEEGKRANNPTNCVYLFQPIQNKPNAFPNYGVALLEVEVDDVVKSDFLEGDRNKDKYIEYTTSRVEVEQIKRVLIPEVFKDRISLPESVSNKITWCGFSADVYENGYMQANSEVIKQFVKTAPIVDSGYYNFFRGITEEYEVIDFYNIRYSF